AGRRRQHMKCLGELPRRTNSRLHSGQVDWGAPPTSKWAPRAAAGRCQRCPHPRPRGRRPSSRGRTALAGEASRTGVPAGRAREGGRQRRAPARAISGTTLAMGAPENVGHLQQLGGTRLVTLQDGVERGVRVVEFRTAAGLDFAVLVDRAMDIAWCRYNRRSISWLCPVGLIGPWYREPEGPGF